MATRIEEILGKDINSLKELREEIKRLQDSIAAVDPETEEFRDTTVKLAAAQEQLTSVTRAGKDANVAATDSIVGMEKEYKNLYNTYKMLTEEQRNSDFGREMASQLETLSQKLNETKQGVGNFKDNIGHYSESIIDAFGKMGISLGGLQKPLVGLVGAFGSGEKSIKGSLDKMKSGIEGINASMAAMGGPAKAAQAALQGVGSAMKALIANPVGAAILAIVVAFKALSAIVDRVKKAINDNEESQMKLKEAMANFQPVIDAVSNAFDKLGTIVVKVIGFIGDAFSKLREIRGAVTDFLGITKGAKNAIQEQNKVYKDIAKSQNELIKNKREYMKLNASDKSEVERLREEASETDNLVEKKKLLEQAKEIQAQIDERNIQTAQEELRILEEQAKLTANDAAMNEKLAQATANVANAQAQAAGNMRMFNKQLAATTSTSSSAGASLHNYREEAKKLYEELIEDNKTEIQKIEEKYAKEKKLLEKYHLDTTLLTRKYEKDKNSVVQEAISRRQQMVLNELEYEQKVISLQSEALQGIAKTQFDKEQAENTINNLEAIKAKVIELKDEWINKGMFISGQGFKQFTDEWKAEAEESFKEIFKPGTIWENLEPPLRDIKEKFDEVTKITGYEIFDIESIDLAVKIVKNKIDGLNDQLVDERIDYQLDENLLEYYTKVVEIIKNKTLTIEEQNEEIEKLDYEQLEKKKAIIEQELSHFQGSLAMRLKLWEEYYQLLEEMRNKDKKKEEEKEESEDELLRKKVEKVEAYKTIFENLLSPIESVTNGLNSMSNGFKTLYKAQLDEGKLSEKEAEKKKKRMKTLEKIVRDATIAQIVAGAAQGIMDTWVGYIKETSIINEQTAAATGPAAVFSKATLDKISLVKAITKTAGLAITAAGQIAAAKGNYISNVAAFEGSNGGGGAAAGTEATPAPIDSTPYTYSRTLQTQEEEDAIYNKNYWVSVTDIESALDKQVKVSEETSF